MTATSEQLWKRRAASLARKVNSGWWLARFNLLFVIGASLLAVVVLVSRSLRDSDFSWPFFGVILLSIFMLAALAAWALTRGRFIGTREGLIRLDDRLHLHNRLTAAFANVGAWPEYKADRVESSTIRWRWTSFLVPSLLALLIALGGLLIPLPASGPDVAVTPNEPGAWEQMEDWLTVFEEEGFIEEETIEEIAQKVAELRDQPEEDWFSHASLEATDSLQEGLGREVRDLADEMEELGMNMAALQKFASNMSDEAKARTIEEYQDALEALESNGMKMDEALLEQLQGIDPSQLAQGSMQGMSEEQMEALQQQLGKGSEALGSLEGLPSMEDDPAMQAMMGQGLQPGQGGIDRGSGEAPLYFGDEDDLKTNKIENVNNTDFSRAAPGELLGVGETEREIDETPVGPRAGGAIGSVGEGGETVWRDEALLPDEKAVLKKYFQ